MNTDLHTWLSDLWARLRPADVLDIAVVAVAIYVIVSWVRRARTRFVLGGLGALAGLYLLARLLDMVLTLVIFQAGLTLAVVTLIVVFQEDIRRAFERIAMRGRLRRPAAASAHTDLRELLVSSLMDLARRRVGALIVLRGGEPLARHLSGGFTLQGRPSEPLFASIFDTGSASSRRKSERSTFSTLHTTDVDRLDAQLPHRLQSEARGADRGGGGNGHNRNHALCRPGWNS